MTRRYSDEFLISELIRFERENSRVPKALDMQGKFGYPGASVYQNHFGSHNKALIKAGFKLNKINDRLDGTETCSYCGKRADEIPNFTNWLYDKNHVRYCFRHGQRGSPDYITGNLDVNTTTGRGRSGEILVLKKLEIGTEFDCSRISRGYKIDMYHKDYGKIDVKTSLLSNDYHNRWGFNFYAKKDADTYICVGLSLSCKYVQHVWIVPNEDEIRNKKSLSISDIPYSLSNNEYWEVLSKPYDDVWQEMIINYHLDECKIFR